MALGSTSERKISHDLKLARVWIPVVVFVCGSLIALGPFLATRNMVQIQERQAVAERGTKNVTRVTNLVTQLRASLRALGANLQQNPSPEAFQESARQLLSPQGFTAVALAKTSDQRYPVIEAAGSGLVVGQAMPPEAVGAIARTTVKEPLATTQVFSSNGQRHIGFTQGSPVAPKGTVIYAELNIESFNSAAIDAVFGTNRDVDSAIYASPQVDSSQILYATTSKLPLGGKRINSESVLAGSSKWTLVTSGTKPLVDSLARSVPWIFLGGIMVVSALVAMLIHFILRRRDAALTMVDISESQQATILDAAREAYVSMNQEGRVIDWSRQAEVLFGWSKQEAIGHRVGDLIIPEEHRAAHAMGITKFLETGEGAILNQRIEVSACLRNGSQLPVELTVWPVKVKGEWNFSAIVHDISERKQAADAMASAHETALEANRLKSEFLANMSHEIRTPMNGVIGMTGLLLRTSLDVEQREYAETVRSSAESLLTLINDILDFSKIEAGKLKLEYVDFDVRATVEEVADMLAENAIAKNLELLTAVDVSVPALVSGDPGRVRQVLLNLVANAVKFTDQGEVTIRCANIADSGVKVRLRFEVSDTGIGIDPDHQTKLFNSFFQVDMSAARRHEGTGLGLAIARQLTELMGGELGLVSGLGEGSTFWFELELEKREGSPVAPEIGLAHLEGVKTLIVDDNATNRKILRTILSDWQMAPSEADGAEAALRMLRDASSQDEPFELALLDFHMPYVDGVELAKRICIDASIKDIKLVLLTSSGDHLSRAELQDTGISHSLTKPVRQVLLHDRMVSALSMPVGESAKSPAQSGRNATSTELTSIVKPGTRVLIVEDNTVNQRVAGRILEKLGCQVDIAANGVEGVEAVGRQDYAVVFMDCQMPQKDGYEATREIRQGENSAKHVPIVAMTASAMKGDREKALAAGMDDYLSKPVRPEELADALRKWIKEEFLSDEPETVVPQVVAGSILDTDLVEQLREVTGDLTELFDSFEVNVAAGIEDLNSALAATDFESAAHCAHKLRGGSATIGASQVAALCKEVEEAADECNAEHLRAAIDRLKVSADATTKVMWDMVH